MARLNPNVIMILFDRCKQDKTECRECFKFHKTFPIPKDFMEKMGVPSREMNGASMFVPEASEQEQGKNKTYLEQVRELTSNPRKQLTPDSDLYGVERCKVRFEIKFHILLICI